MCRLTRRVMKSGHLARDVEAVAGRPHDDGGGLPGRLQPSFAPVATHHGAAVDICPSRRAKRNGAVERRHPQLFGDGARSTFTEYRLQAGVGPLFMASGPTAFGRPDQTPGVVVQHHDQVALPAAPCTSRSR